jgi:protein ImuB
LTLRRGNSDHLHCLNPAAEARGLHRGLGLADARAICPDLATRPADLAAEAEFLATLIRWAGRYSPWVGRDGADGLAADLTGVAHLFGGEVALLADARARLARAGIAAAGGIADSRGAAHALARHRKGGGIAPPGEALAALAPLPPVALRIDSDTAAGLSRLGLRRIGDLLALPRPQLARRFGPALLMRLDQALGRAPEPLDPAPAPPVLATRLTLPEPIGLLADVEVGLARLLDPLAAALARAGLGARRMRLEMRRVDGQDAVAEIGLARPMRDPARIGALFRPALERVDAGFGIDRLRLAALQVEPLAPAQLATRGGTDADRLADLVTRLGNRLGFDRVQRLAPAESHLPEKSFLRHPAAYAPEGDPGGWPAGRPRPLLIFPPEPVRAVPDPAPPVRFRWRRVGFATARATGPERIAPEWWLDDPAWRTGVRDYWRIETEQGRRLWLFHTPQDPAWFAQGEFA